MQLQQFSRSLCVDERFTSDRYLLFPNHVSFERSFSISRFENSSSPTFRATLIATSLRSAPSAVESLFLRPLHRLQVVSCKDLVESVAVRFVAA